MSLTDALQTSVDRERGSRTHAPVPRYTGLRLHNFNHLPVGDKTCVDCAAPAEYGVRNDPTSLQEGSRDYCHFCYMGHTLDARAAADDYALRMGDPAPAIVTTYHQDTP